MAMFESYTEPEDIYIELELDDGKTEECVVLLRYPLNEQQYIALTPVSQMDNDEAEIYFYRFAEDENGEVMLTDIESDEEFEEAADRFEEITDDFDFDELASDDE